MKKTKLYLLVSLFSLGSLGANANSLLDVYEVALQNDTLLKADQAKYKAGLENKALARAGLLPQINAGYQYNKNDTTTTNNLLNTEVEGDTTSKGWDISLNQQLFDMSLWYTYQQGTKLSQQAEAQFGADQQSLIVRVSEAYFNVLRAVDTLEATIAEEKALAKQQEQTRQRFDVGLTAITEVHEAQAAYDSARAATLGARANLSVAFEALEVITGKPEDKVAPLSAQFPVVAPTPTNRAEWVEFSLQNNYNLKASRLQAEATRQAARSAKARHLPTLSASLGYSDNDTDGNSFNQLSGGQVAFDNTTEGSRVTLNLNVPIFSGGETSARSRQVQANYVQAQEMFNNLQRNVIQNTRSLHLLVETDVATVQARKQAIVSSQSALEATQSGYQVGTRNLVEVLLSQRNLYQARRDYANALYDYVINGIKLREVAGLLTPADVQDIDKWLSDAQLVTREQYER